MGPQVGRTVGFNPSGLVVDRGRGRPSECGSPQYDVRGLQSNHGANGCTFHGETAATGSPAVRSRAGKVVGVSGSSRSPML